MPAGEGARDEASDADRFDVSTLSDWSANLRCEVISVCIIESERMCRWPREAKSESRSVCSCETGRDSVEALELLADDVPDLRLTSILCAASATLAILGSGISSATIVSSKALALPFSRKYKAWCFQSMQVRSGPLQTNERGIVAYPVESK